MKSIPGVMSPRIVLVDRTYVDRYVYNLGTTNYSYSIEIIDVPWPDVAVGGL